MIYTIDVKGKPIPKARPRMTRAGHAYTPKRTKAREFDVALAWFNKYGNTLTDKPLRISIKYTFAVPVSWKKWKQEEAMNGTMLHTSRPDLDNLNKAVLDGLNGVAYRDDSQIVMYGTIIKTYGKEDNTRIEIIEL